MRIFRRGPSGTAAGLARALVAAAAILVPGAGAAAAGTAADSFCRDLKQVIRIAEEEGGFTRLERSSAAPPTFGFRSGCRIYPATERLPSAWWCSQTLAPEALSLASLAGRTAACLPTAVRTRGAFGREATFTLPRARIRISEHGGPRAQVGRIVSFRVEAVAAK